MANTLFVNRLFYCLFFILILTLPAFAQQKSNGIDASLSNLYKLSDAQSRSISPENFTGD